MSSITSLISGGGGAGAPVNSIAQLFVDGEILYTDETGGVWLKTGFGITPDSVTYPDTEVTLALSAASFTQLFSVAAQELNPQGIAFNTDGTKMFIVGDFGDDVNEYALSTGFDVSTASFTTIFSVSAQDNAPSGIAFNNDGTKMFISGTQLARIYEYALSTAFSVSSASYTTQLLVNGEDNLPQDLAFNNDGTKMFMIGSSGDRVYQYALSTAFSVSTASFTTNFSVLAQDNTPSGIAFNNDGTSMFILGAQNNRVYQYYLNDFDISSAYFVQLFSVAAQESNSRGIAFNNDGTKMFIIGTVGDDVNQYSIPQIMGLTTNTGTYDYLKLK